MSMAIIDDSMVSNSAETQTIMVKLAAPNEEDFAKCDCCGLTEECTLAYIETIRERYHGKWICGLCAEAIKYEAMRCERLISAEEALTRHSNFCKTFSSSDPPPNPSVHLITAMRQILRKSLDSPNLHRSVPSSPTKKSREIKPSALTRSESCIPTLSFVDSTSFHAMKMDQGCE